jgi:hypothetical protein
MKLEAIARALAVALGIVGVVDPVWQTTDRSPRAVELQLEPGADAMGVKARLEQALRDEVTFSADHAPVARVVVGDALPPTVDRIPTSFVSLAPESTINTRVVAVAEPAAAMPGWRTAVTAVIEGRGVAGSTSGVVLERSGVELGRTEHKWTGTDERASVTIPFVPPSEGPARLSLRVLPLEGERIEGDNVADVRAVVRARRLKVLVHEARPSWIAAFVRRVLEANPAFDVSASVAASKGLAVNAGAAPARLRQLDEFETVLVGAPEDLTSADVDALETFVRRRGGAVVLLPDRRPSGPYVRLLRSREFDEVLIETPVTAQGQEGALQASELALPRGSIASPDVLASVEREGGRRAVVFGAPLGDGRVVFSGAMDAWRFRAADETGFARFWTSTVAGLALSAPPRLDLSAYPGIVKPGDFVGVRLRLRRSELNDSASRVDVPAVRARLIAASGTEELIRLWPGAEPGVFEGRVKIPEVGTFDVSASSGAATADTVVIAAADVRTPDDGDARRGAIAAATGGVHVGAQNLEPLVRSLRALTPARASRDAHPARSVWFVAAFAALLGAEWTMRRRAGRR